LLYRVLLVKSERITNFLKGIRYADFSTNLIDYLGILLDSKGMLESGKTR